MLKLLPSPPRADLGTSSLGLLFPWVSITSLLLCILFLLGEVSCWSFLNPVDIFCGILQGDLHLATFWDVHFAHEENHNPCPTNSVCVAAPSAASSLGPVLVGSSPSLLHTELCRQKDSLVCKFTYAWKFQGTYIRLFQECRGPHSGPMGAQGSGSCISVTILLERKMPFILSVLWFLGYKLCLFSGSWVPSPLA